MEREQPTVHEDTINEVVADHLLAISEMYEQEGNKKWITYRKAARAIRKAKRDIKEVELTEYKGIGPAIAAHIKEFLMTQTTERFEELRKMNDEEGKAITNRAW